MGKGCKYSMRHFKGLVRIAAMDLEEAEYNYEKSLELPEDSYFSEDSYLAKACFDLQQTIEKCLKFLLGIKNRYFKQPHDINNLCFDVSETYPNDEVIQFLINKIIENGNLYTYWEFNPRYDIDFSEDPLNVIEAMGLAHELLKECQNRLN